MSRDKLVAELINAIYNEEWERAEMILAFIENANFSAEIIKGQLYLFGER